MITAVDAPPSVARIAAVVGIAASSRRSACRDARRRARLVPGRPGGRSGPHKSEISFADGARGDLLRGVPPARTGGGAKPPRA